MTTVQQINSEIKAIDRLLHWWHSSTCSCLTDPFPAGGLLSVVLHSVWVSSMEVKACNRGGGVEAQLPGHTVQVGQLEVNTAHRQHTGLKEVDITVVVTGNLKETDTENMLKKL